MYKVTPLVALSPGALFVIPEKPVRLIIFFFRSWQSCTATHDTGNVGVLVSLLYSMGDKNTHDTENVGVLVFLLYSNGDKNTQDMGNGSVLVFLLYSMGDKNTHDTGNVSGIL